MDDEPTPEVTEEAPAAEAPLPLEPGRRWPRRLLWSSLGLLGLVAIVGGGLFVYDRLRDDSGDSFLGGKRLPSVSKGKSDDPFKFHEGQERLFEVRGATGLAHVLFAKSPNGVLESARKTALYRPQVDEAATRGGVDPDTLEAMVLLESAGRPEVIAGNDPAAATGLMQIVAETGQNLLGMDIDLAESRALTKKIEKAARRGRDADISRYRRRRRQVDERFDPAASLAAGVRYLVLARKKFGRDDLAVASYHMGIGNLERVVKTFVSPGDVSGQIGDVVARNDLSYARLFYDSSPLLNPKTHKLLQSFGDDSSTYYWRVLAAKEIMRLFRSNPDELDRLDELHSHKATAEEVFHPEDETKIYDEPGDVKGAIDDGELVRIPDAPGRYGFRIARQMGQLARRLDEERELYGAMRPEALAVLEYISDRVRKATGRNDPLIVTSGVRDQKYQGLLIGVNAEATDEYSLHTTGYAFDIFRKYKNKAQAQAFQAELDRLRALAVIDYAVEPQAIHITVSDEAKALLK